MKSMNVGIIGCGNISDAYFNGAKTFKSINITHCADINLNAAKEKAEKFGCIAVSVDDLLSNPEIEIVLNLTIPKAHAAVNMEILKAGKHVYVEKPFALTIEEAKPVIELAAQKGLRVGCAPDTFFGGGLQACKKLIEDNWLGKIYSGTAFMLCPGHESWHPAPEFYYQIGGGPLLDMGPYYLTALINFLGPVKRVCAMANKISDKRICTSENRMGDLLPVEINTHTTGVLEFESGAIITMIMSFDIACNTLPNIELHGTLGSLSVPDPNTFDGPVKFSKRGEGFKEVPIPFIYTDNKRSIGLADMIEGIIKNRPHRASGELAYHVLDVMNSLDLSGKEGLFIDIKSSCKKIEGLKLGLTEGELS